MLNVIYILSELFWPLRLGRFDLEHVFCNLLLKAFSTEESAGGKFKAIQSHS